MASFLRKAGRGLMMSFASVSMATAALPTQPRSAPITPEQQKAVTDILSAPSPAGSHGSWIEAEQARMNAQYREVYGPNSAVVLIDADKMALMQAVTGEIRNSNLIYRYLEPWGMQRGTYGLVGAEIFTPTAMSAPVQMIISRKRGEMPSSHSGYDRLCLIEGISANTRAIDNVVYFSNQVMRRTPVDVSGVLSENAMRAMIVQHEFSHCLDSGPSNLSDFFSVEYRHKIEVEADVYAALQALRQGVTPAEMRVIADMRAINVYALLERHKNNHGSSFRDLNPVPLTVNHTAPALDAALAHAQEMGGDRLRAMSFAEVMQLSKEISARHTFNLEQLNTISKGVISGTPDGMAAPQAYFAFQARLDAALARFMALPAYRPQTRIPAAQSAERLERQFLSLQQSYVKSGWKPLAALMAVKEEMLRPRRAKLGALDRHVDTEAVKPLDSEIATIQRVTASQLVARAAPKPAG